MAVLHSFRSARITPTRILIRIVVLLALLSSSLGVAQLVRVANTTLTLPQNPQTFGYRTEDAFPGITFNQPLGFASAPGETDRVFVIEKPGRIQVVTGLRSTPVKQLFLDLTSRVLVSDGTEEGLLGLAFHPDFATNHYFYVFYTTNYNPGTGASRHDRLSRFTALPAPATNADILATEVPLISQRDEETNHNGGDLHFGSDGYLYVSLGDEGGGNDSFNNGQRIDKDFFSGLLRIDVDRRPGNLAPNSHASVHPGTYSVPADNPFNGTTSFNGATVAPGNVRTEFWAVGLRNPWRFSIDAPTGRIFVGDVGQGAREEIDLITRGGNYGWSYREGTIAGPRANPPAAASFIDPIWDAGRSTATSITGGWVYRGSRFAQLYGRYVFADYSGPVFAMTFPASGPVQVQQLLVENSPVGLGVDPRNGDILIANIATGVIRRLVYDSTSTGTPLPATLSATGAFSDVATLIPAAGVVPYEPNVAFWSDHATKRRWFSVPALANKITFAADGNWTFPAGTVWVKHFELELTRGDPNTARRIETRFLVKTAGGVYGVTYRWNTAQTEAMLVPEEGANETITINDGGLLRPQTWRYPSRAECLQCHTTVGGHALSFNTAQLNRTAAYGSVTTNQLNALADAGYFTSSIPAPSTLRALAPASDSSTTIEHRVRSYLAANCVQCHQPGGAAQGNWDARIATPTVSAGLINGTLINPAGDSANRVIVLGDTTHSMLLNRISRRGDGQMPPLASNELDQAAITLLTNWITGVGDIPVIMTHPVTQTVPVGSPVNFSVVATGSPAPTYQWRKNSVNIPGATAASYAISSTTVADAGAYTVVATNSAGSVTSNPAILTLMASAGDINGDGKSDIFWSNATTGECSVWYMNGSAASGGATLGAVPAAWKVSGTADFNGDGRADVLWSNTSTGDRAMWLMNGSTIITNAFVSTVPLTWLISGTGDFNGDGKADILWSNTVSGDRAIWLMNGSTIDPGSAYLATIAVEWKVGGIGDFNGDGRADILWSNTTTGERSLWFMNGSAAGSGTSLGFVPVAWVISGAGDFNGDGKTDILWSNTTTGNRAVWLMNGANVITNTFVGTVPLEWKVSGTGDFNGDGRADIVWSNIATGDRAVWLMNGGTVSGGAIVSTVPVEWKINAEP